MHKRISKETSALPGFGTIKLFLLMIYLCFIPAVALAQTPVLQTKTIEIEGNLRVDNDFNPDEKGELKYNLHTQRFELQASVKLPRLVPESIVKQILFVVRSRMEQDVVVNGILAVNHLSAADYLKEAYVEFKEVGGLPIAVVIGTSEVSYGQDYPSTIDFQNDAAHAMTDPDRGQVKGFAIALEKSILPIFDHVEASFFDSDPNFTDAGIRHLDGFAVRVTKNLGDSLTLQTSLLDKGNGYDRELKPETDLSFGGVYRKGAWAFWGEGIKMRNSEAYPNAPIGFTAGASRISGPGQIDVEATGIRNTLNQYALGYELFLNRQWAIGSTFRYTFCVGGNAGCVSARSFGQGPSIGVSVRLAFGGDNQNPTSLRKKSKIFLRKLPIFSSFGHQNY